jgi:hypothetical protein
MAHFAKVSARSVAAAFRAIADDERGDELASD